MTDEDLVGLEEIFNSMMVHHDDINKFSKADYLFHRKIAESSKNPILIQANHSIVSILGCAIGIRYHRLLLANMRRRDKAACEQLMEEHIQATIDGVQSFLEENKEPIQ
ncbi:MAG: FCD domain-containing protein [Sphaerochaeta sp.]|nr:FCD domain-containing protein [Sphaerochaeta sp.]